MKVNRYKTIAFVFALVLTTAVANASTVTGTLTTPSVSTNDITGVLIAAPTASPVAGVYEATQTVALTSEGAMEIRYTFDGTDPTCSSIKYESTIEVADSQVIQALSCYANGQTSEVASFAYGISPASPVVTGGGGGGGGSIIVTTTTVSGGDINNDTKIDILDFVILMANWGSTTSNNIADLNGDNKVDILDFVILMANWTN